MAPFLFLKISVGHILNRSVPFKQNKQHEICRLSTAAVFIA